MDILIMIILGIVGGVMIVIVVVFGIYYIYWIKKDKDKEKVVVKIISVYYRCFVCIEIEFFV